MNDLIKVRVIIEVLAKVDRVYSNHSSHTLPRINSLASETLAEEDVMLGLTINAYGYLRT